MNTYSKIPLDLCLAHGNIKMPNENVFIQNNKQLKAVKILHCNHLRNYGAMYKKFNFDWKVVKVIEDPPKYIIMSGDGKHCLTKKRIKVKKDKDDDEEEEEEEVDLNDLPLDKYLQYNYGFMEGTFTMKKCAYSEKDLFNKEPEFDLKKIDKKDFFIFTPGKIKLSNKVLKEILHNWGYTKHLEGQGGVKILDSPIGYNF